MLGSVAWSQINFDRNQFSEKMYATLQEKLVAEYKARIDKIKKDIPKSVENYREKRISQLETQIAQASNLDYLLSDFEAFGIDAQNLNLSAKAREVFTQVKGFVESDDSVKIKDLKGIINSQWKTVATEIFDKESVSMMEGYYDLLKNAQKQLQAINEIAEESELDEAKLIEKLKEYGLSGDYLEKIKPLERIMRSGWNQIPDPKANFELLSNAFGSDNPADKIEALFILGAKYGDKIPIVGSMVADLFEVGKRMLSATKRIGLKISANFNQGCIYGPGHYGEQMQPMVQAFHAKFPNIEACPILFMPKDNGKMPTALRPENQVIRPKIYGEAYFDITAETYLFFYINGTWSAGTISHTHTGEKDLKNIVIWLRSNGLADLVVDSKKIEKIYNQPVGFTAYEKQLREKITELKEALFGFQAPLSQFNANNCSKRKVESYLDPIINLTSLYDLFPQDDQPTWENISDPYDWPWRELLTHAQMTRYASILKQQKYIGASRSIDPLKVIDNILKKINFHVIKINGTIRNPDGSVAVGIRANFDADYELFPGNSTQCRQEYSDENGYFRYLYIMSRLSAKTHEISATNIDGEATSERFEIDPTKNKYYTVNLQFGNSCPDGFVWNGTDLRCDKKCGPNSHPEGSGINQICVCDEGFRWNADGTLCIPDLPSDSSQSGNGNPCSDILNAVASTDSVNGTTLCSCEDPLVMNLAQNACVTKREAAEERIDCSQIPYSKVTWNPATEVATCTCKEGYVWNSDRTECIDSQRPPDDYCDVFPNSEIVKMDNGGWGCNCKSGFVWNEDHDACITKQQDAINRSDCSDYPNTTAVWSDAEDGVICDCVNGYEWNENGQCIPNETTAATLADCSQYPNTKPIWSNLDSALVCDCIDGFIWKDDLSGCEKLSKSKLCDEAYPNTIPVLDKRTNEYFCECKKGYEWNKNETGCVPTEATAIANSDCYRIPNAIAKYNARTQTVKCVCRTGYKWNASGSACEKDPSFTENMTQITDALINIGNQMGGGGIDSPDNPQVAAENQHQGECNTKYSGSGANVPQQYTIPHQGGKLSLWYNTLTVKDRVHVYQGSKKIFDSGCVGTENTVELNASPFMGSIRVVIDPRCDGTDDTKWYFTLNCSE